MAFYLADNYPMEPVVIPLKRSRAIVIILICIAALALLATAGYFIITRSEEPATDTTTAAQKNETVSLYFLDSSKTTLVAEQREVEPLPDREFIERLVNLLIEGPRDSVEKKRAIPEDTRILSVSINGSIATVDFSAEFYGQTDIDSSLAAATVVKTLCDTRRVSKAIILVEGEALIGSNEVELGALGSDDIVYSGSQSSSNNNTTVLTLYFADKTGQSLQVENRTVTQNDKEPLAKIAITELMNGSQTDGQKLIPAEAKLLSIEVSEGICFVNFSKEFVDKHQPGSTAEILTIYSIVNTLTELNNITRVQFLIEGQKVETFGEMIFDEPFSRNESLIKASPTPTSE